MFFEQKESWFYDLSDDIIDPCEFFALEKLYYTLYMYIYDIYFHQFHNIVNYKESSSFNLWRLMIVGSLESWIL